MTVTGEWSRLVKRQRLRLGLTQQRLGKVIGVSQRTVSRWERGEDAPSIEMQQRLRDLGWEPPGVLLASLSRSIAHCPFPRALSRTQRLTLQCLSPAAVRKRPSVTAWIGEDLARIACGVLQEMLDDRALQKAIAAREIACVVSTTRSVLKTAEHARIGVYRTVSTYFFHDGTFYSDAISMPVPNAGTLGYRAIAMDEIGSEA
jgi:transcriptional regulator with XRE-family HTH domain